MMNLASLINTFRELFKEEPTLIISSPGRLDLLNTHQDYKGLPVVSAGINLRTYIAFKARSDHRVHIYSLNIRDQGRDWEALFDIGDSKPSSWTQYIWGCVEALRRRGYGIRGFNALVYSDLPLGGGLGSSGSLEVSLVAGLDRLFGLGLSEKEIAEISYYAEHDVLGIPCGRLDQYSSTYGGLLVINMRPPYNVVRLPDIGGVFGVIDTGIRHSTSEIHPRRQREIDRGLTQLLEQDIPNSLRAKLGRDHKTTRWEDIEIVEIMPYLKKIDRIARKRILFTLLMNRSTRLVIDMLLYKRIDYKLLNHIIDEISETIGFRNIHVHDTLEILGLIMTYQHILLSKMYDVSLPVIDRIVNELIEYGALGAKLSGAGMGGAIVALFESKNTAEKILDTISRKYNIRYWIVEINDGVEVNYQRQTL